MDCLARCNATADDLLDPAAISAMTQIGHDRADSLHRLVMDLHKRLNLMQVELAEEMVDGAAAWRSPRWSLALKAVSSNPRGG
jgi:hypothetical protein